MNDELSKRTMLYKLIYSLFGLVLGLTCILVGGYLGLSGVAGNSRMVAEVLGLKTELSDATPGVVLFVVGIFMVWITRFNPRIRETIQHETPMPTTERQGGGGSSGMGFHRVSRDIAYQKPPHPYGDL